MNDLYLEIVSPEAILFEGPVGMVDIPGTMGRFTILRDHAPIVSTLSAGRVRVISKDGRELFFPCREGVVECKDNHLTLLIDHHPDTAIKPSDF